MQINYLNPAFKEDFKKFLISRGVSENTAKNHISQAVLFLEKVNGKLSMLKEELAQEILEFFNSKRVYSSRYSLRFLFSFVDLKTEFKTNFSKIYEEIVKEHRKIFRQKEREAKRKWLTKEEFREILNNLPYNYRLFFQMQYETACRSGALVNLKVQDVMKREGGVVTITLREKGSKISTFTLSNTLSQLLLHRIQNKQPLARVFDFGYSSINNNFNDASFKVLGYPASTHYVRASRLVHLLQEGYDIETIKRVAKHSSINTTYRYLMDAGVDVKEIVADEKVKWLYGDNSDNTNSGNN